MHLSFLWAPYLFPVLEARLLPLTASTMSPVKIIPIVRVRNKENPTSYVLRRFRIQNVDKKIEFFGKKVKKIIEMGEKVGKDMVFSLIIDH